MRSPVSDERRALWRKQRDFISEWGRPYLSEWERDFFATVDGQVTANLDLSFKQSASLGRIYAQLQARLG